MGERLGRMWKLGVMVAAGLGTLSFFMPFLEISHGPARVPVSAYRILIGFDDVAQIDPVLRSLPETDRAQVLESWNTMVGYEVTTTIEKPFTRQQASRIPYFYLATALLLVIAAIAVARRELGFLASLGTLAAGLVALWGWTREALLVRHSFLEGGSSVALSSGATLLAIAGAIALVAGVGALVWADPGGFRARRKISVQVRRGEAPVVIDMPTDQQSAAMPTATLRVRSTRPDNGKP